MKNFMDENFLLQTETAQKLYHEHAAKMPIIDYHCHLIPQMVADDYKFKSLTEIWLFRLKFSICGLLKLRRKLQKSSRLTRQA